MTPVLVDLAPSSPSALVAVRNTGAAAARFEVAVRAWAQSPAGQMELAATEDVAAYPPILVLAPGEERNVRVRAATPFGAVEKSYRLFIQEIPAPRKAGAPAEVRVLSRIGIPVFLAPSKAVERAAIEALSLAAGAGRFSLANTGTVHVRAMSVRAVLEDASGAPLVERDLPAWYVLPGGQRDYELEVPPDACAKVRRLRVVATLQREVLRAQVAAPDGACPR